MYLENKNDNENNLEKRKLRSYIDDFIRDGFNNGIIFFQISINALNYPEFQNNLDYLDKLEWTCINMGSFLCEFKLVTFIYTSVELNNKNIPHFHTIIGFKSIIGYNDVLEFNITKLLNNKQELVTIDDMVFPFDFKLNELKNFYDVKQFFNYILKDVTKYKIPHYASIEDILLESSFTKVLNSLHENNIVVNWGKRTKIHHLLPSIKKQGDYYSEYTLINMFNFYLILKNLKWHNDWLFEKVEDFEISYKEYMSMDEFVNNINNIYIELMNNFQLHLENIDLYNIKLKYFNKVISLLNDPRQILVNQAKINFDYIEFIDGVYNIKQDLFIKKDINKDWKKPLYVRKKYFINGQIKEIVDSNNITTKHYNITFRYASATKPKLWLEELKTTIHDDKEMKSLLIYFGSLFNNSTDLLGKQRVLYIYGEPNTKKTTLTAKVLTNFFGVKNVGYITKNKTFALENILGKEIAIFDEFEHYNLALDVILKLLEGTEILIDKKFKKSELLKRIRILIISNNKVSNKLPTIIKNAFDSRINYVQFKNGSSQQTNDLYEKLIREEPHIVIYCNREFKKSLNKNKNEIIQVKTKKTQHLDER